jgi:hypothetical protein
MFYKLLMALSTVTLVSCAQASRPAQSQETAPAKNIMCTMDAIQCSDGSWVGRSAPDCAFKCAEPSK